MLREVINKHIKPRIAPFQATIASSVATVNIGYGDYTVSTSAAGVGRLTPRQGFYRNGLLFLSQYTTAGGYATYNSATADNDAFPFSILNASGTAVDGVVDGFTFGWDSPDLSLTKAQRVSATQDAPRIIWGKVTGTTGVVAINTRDFDCTRASTGVYNVTFKTAFGKIPSVLVTGVSANATTMSPRLSSKTAKDITVTMTDAAGTPADANFYILAIGSDSRSDSARGRMPLENTQRKPRIVVAQVTMASGTPSITIGGATGGADAGGIVDNGAGDFTLTFSEIFKREPAVFLCSTTQRSQIRSNLIATNGLLRVLVQNAAGSNTDVDGVTNIFVIGSDDAASY